MPVTSLIKEPARSLAGPRPINLACSNRAKSTRDMVADARIIRTAVQLLRQEQQQRLPRLAQRNPVVQARRRARPSRNWLRQCRDCVVKSADFERAKFGWDAATQFQPASLSRIVRRRNVARGATS